MTARLPDDLPGLARYAIGRPWWGWRLPDGPTVSDRGRLLRRGLDGVLWVDMAPPGPADEWLPDLTDGATLGCLLHRLREVACCPGLGVCQVAALGPYDNHVTVVWAIADSPAVPYPFLRTFTGPTEAHVLIAALDAAWDATRPSR